MKSPYTQTQVHGEGFDVPLHLSSVSYVVHGWCSPYRFGIRHISARETGDSFLRANLVLSQISVLDAHPRLSHSVLPNLDSVQELPPTLHCLDLDTPVGNWQMLEQTYSPELWSSLSLRSRHRMHTGSEVGPMDPLHRTSLHCFYGLGCTLNLQHFMNNRSPRILDFVLSLWPVSEVN